MVDSLEKIFCVIGDPIAHSLSPQIHQFIFKRLNIDCRYEAIRVSSNELYNFIQLSTKGNRPGFNVTIPHKEKILPFLDEIDPSAKAIGAINTVSNQNGKLIGYNTDVFGMRLALEHHGWSPQGLAILLGAGGAARAAMKTLSLMGTKKVILFDLIPERSLRLKANFKKHHPMDITIGSLEKGDLEKYLKETDLLINATPVGMWPNVEATPVPHAEYIQSETTVLDMVYNPKETLLLREAKARGAKPISGLNMLIAQAIAAEEIWLDRSILDALFDPLCTHIQSIMEKNG